MAGFFVCWFIYVCLLQRKQLYIIFELTNWEETGAQLPVLKNYSWNVSDKETSKTGPWTWTACARVISLSEPQPDPGGGLTVQDQWQKESGAQQTAPIGWTASKGERVSSCLWHLSVMNIFLVTITHLLFQWQMVAVMGNCLLLGKESVPVCAGDHVPPWACLVGRTVMLKSSRPGP